jgi:hypothetical protein
MSPGPSTAPKSGETPASADQTAPPPAPDACARCGRRLAERSGYRLPDGERRCIRCVWRHRAIVRRALVTALIVGTILTIINQGNHLLAGDLSWPLLVRIGLTYLVPYCVSTSGAVGLSRVQ